jgi:hypothetical protein
MMFDSKWLWNIIYGKILTGKIVRVRYEGLIWKCCEFMCESVSESNDSYTRTWCAKEAAIMLAHALLLHYKYHYNRS